MLGEIELTSTIPASCVQTRWIERIAYANDAWYFRLVPQAVLQLNSIGEIQYVGEQLGKKLVYPRIIRTIRSMEVAVTS